MTRYEILKRSPGRADCSVSLITIVISMQRTIVFLKYRLTKFQRPTNSSKQNLSIRQ